LKGSVATGVLFFLIGNIIAWFQFNSQFAWDWWKDKPLITNFIFSVPMGLCFWYAVKNIVLATGQLWSSKLIGFGVSNIVFGLLTYFFLKESVFAPKTLICLFLASAIIAIQVLWK
tara:strand:+ start:3036 stop:3383 length:348 start_codon:yes stop_codon:yes gene_type:complete